MLALGHEYKLLSPSEVNALGMILAGGVNCPYVKIPMGYSVERFPTLSKRKIERGLIAITLGKPSYY